MPPIGSSFAALPAQLRGTVWLILSVTFLLLSLAIVRDLAPKMHVFELVLFRAAFCALAMMPWLARSGFQALRTERIGLMALRCVLGVTNLVLVFAALALMPLADV